MCQLCRPEAWHGSHQTAIRASAGLCSFLGTLGEDPFPGSSGQLPSSSSRCSGTEGPFSCWPSAEGCSQRPEASHSLIPWQGTRSITSVGSGRLESCCPHVPDCYLMEHLSLTPGGKVLAFKADVIRLCSPAYFRTISPSITSITSAMHLFATVRGTQLGHGYLCRRGWSFFCLPQVCVGS